ncbi:hypothetical protein NLX83_13560 [Allokutzneria sp. A3M-2-11 16]|uniref:hypothetical protein n=1 Tax=Allokutzneria sp. A3M-2-11 16 TaxID=2962043 RepID=UPI0020B6687E|nr:hypothetical protein [Allokutzneria sp. A3M-2-11 16]MCP3800285.1 hypothetical protein [Allokutzneria sp. A3M-2-11 16]
MKVDASVGIVTQTVIVTNNCKSTASSIVIEHFSTNCVEWLDVKPDGWVKCKWPREYKFYGVAITMNGKKYYNPR